MICSSITKQLEQSRGKLTFSNPHGLPKRVYSKQFHWFKVHPKYYQLGVQFWTVKGNICNSNFRSIFSFIPNAKGTLSNLAKVKAWLFIPLPRLQNVPHIPQVSGGLDTKTGWSLVGLGAWRKGLVKVADEKEVRVPLSASRNCCSLESTGKFFRCSEPSK